jgi:hypothetical protein
MTLKELLDAEQKLLKEASDMIAKYLEPIDTQLDNVRKEITAKVAEPTKLALANGRKDAGTINFNLDGVQVKATIGKTIKWDQNGLREMAKKIQAAGDNPDDYIETKTDYKISENRFKNFSEAVKNTFLPFREVKTGSPKYEYTIPEAKELPDADMPL